MSKSARIDFHSPTLFVSRAFFIVKVGLLFILVAGGLGSGAQASDQIQKPRTPSAAPLDGSAPCEGMLAEALKLAERALSEIPTAPVAPGHADSGLRGYPTTGASKRQILKNTIELEQSLKQIKSAASPILNLMLAFHKFQSSSADYGRRFHELIQRFYSVSNQLRSEQTRTTAKGALSLEAITKQIDESLKNRELLLKELEPFQGAKALIEHARTNEDAKEAVQRLITEVEGLYERAHDLPHGQSIFYEIYQVKIRLQAFLQIAMGLNESDTLLNLRAFEDISEKLWLAQSDALRRVSKYTDRYANIPIDHALDEVYAGLDQHSTSGDLLRDPKSEPILIKVPFGFLVGYVGESFEEANKLGIKRSNIALLDPNISIDGLSRGTLLTDKNGQKWGLVGFFPNANIALQRLNTGTPQIISLPLKNVLRMDPQSNPNISRSLLVGDRAIRVDSKQSPPVKEEFEFSNPTVVANRKPFNLPSVLSSWLTLLSVGIGTGYVISSGSLLPLIPAAAGGLAMCVTSTLASLKNRRCLPEGLASEDTALITTTTHFERNYASDLNVARRADEVWISSKSLSTEELEILGITDGEWFVSPSGDRAKVEPSEKPWFPPNEWISENGERGFITPPPPLIRVDFETGRRGLLE